MNAKDVHPNLALFKGEKPFPIIPSCEHFAGNELRIGKAFELQAKLGPIFDVTCDCEDGAPAGQERQHAEMIARMQNSAANKFRQAGVRIHDYTHPAWKQDIDILVGGAGEMLAYITIPKSTSAAQAGEMIEYAQKVAAKHGVKREIPDSRADRNPRRPAPRVRHRRPALGAGAGLRPDGFRFRAPRRDPGLGHAQPGPV
ncbi:MAG: hypothetical protein WDN04_17700 [Rhodospirillales bacterium]